MDTNRSSCAQAIVSDPFTITLVRIKARQLCRRSDFSRSDYDDLRQDMRLYLLEKAHLFDPERGTLEAFVTRILRTWVAMRLRYRSRQKRCESHKVVSLERTPVEYEGGITSLGAVLLEEDGRRLTQTCPISAIEHVELREDIDQVMRSLEHDDRALLTRMAEHGVTRTAKSLGVSYRQVDNAMKRIRTQFRKAGFGPN